MRLCYNIFYTIKSPNNNKKKNQTPSTEQTFFFVIFHPFAISREQFFLLCCCRIPIDAVVGQKKRQKHRIKKYFMIEKKLLKYVTIFLHGFPYQKNKNKIIIIILQP